MLPDLWLMFRRLPPYLMLLIPVIQIKYSQNYFIMFVGVQTHYILTQLPVVWISNLRTNLD